jgi:proteasome lid subunit RPN8/RPN11
VPIRLSNTLLAQIRDHAAREYPHECCGVLLGRMEGNTKTVYALRPMTNVHAETHERRYLIPPEEMFRLEQEARSGAFQILGFYHSHPDHPARPSEYDREWAWPWYSYIILSVVSGKPGELTCWTLDDDREAFSAETILVSDS